MTTVRHKLFLMGASLMLVSGGVITIAVLPVQAATITANVKQGEKVGSVEMPYTLVTTKDGPQRVYWESKAPQSLTSDQINDTDFVAKFVSDYPTLGNLFQDPGLQKTLNELMDKVNRANRQDSLIDFVVSTSDDNGLSASDYAKRIVQSITQQSWIVSRLAQYKTNAKTFKEIQKDYQENFRPLIEALPDDEDGNKENLLQQLDFLFNTEESTLDTNASRFISMFKTEMFLSSYSDAQLAEIDPDASAAQMSQILQQPLSKYLHPQADGTLQIDGLLLSGLMAYSTIMPDPIVPNPTPTPDPNPSTSQAVTVKYVDQQGKALAPTATLTGKLGGAYHAQAAKIDGYQVTKTPANTIGTFTTEAQTVTYVYEPQVVQNGAAATIAPKGSVIYAIKKIGLYQTPTFSTKQRLVWYAKQKRTNRPMFVVTGYAKSVNGVKRYRVKDVNHHSKTAGKTGYVTTNTDYTVRVYYAKRHVKIKVINAKGVNAYQKKNLTGKRAHYRYGQQLKVKKIVPHNLTTRFVLSNGTYVTANKKLVMR
nr:MucBP domain-containing protein [Levilactobacillus brevis]